MLSTLKHIQSRRSDLKKEINLTETFDQWEETCVPSYCHKNWMAAYVSWQRLFRSVELAKKCRPNPERIVDFGSSVGELGHLLKETCSNYTYIEQDEAAASYLASRLPHATRTSLEDAQEGTYDWIFAIDSLEHNDNFAELVQIISTKLTDNGIFVLSGPTENALYKLGRKIAGFSGDYHKTNIYDIEDKCREHLELIRSSTIVPGMPLFSVTVWQKQQ